MIIFIFKHLFNNMKTNNILSKCQSVFLPNDSTVNQLIEIYHNIIKIFNWSKTSCSVIINAFN
jgi:hypothetical protein